MRRTARIAPILALIAIMLMGTLSVGAYTYEISVSAGNGTFSGGVVRDTTTPDTVNVDQSACKITIGSKEFVIEEMPDGKAPADSKYFMTGLKLAGNDNSGANTSSAIMLDGVYKEKDLEFVVAYGMKSSMVSYTISYLDTTGNEIHPADTFYGVAGENVIVSYKYVDGYIPQGLTGVAKLSANSDENNFAFVYDTAGGTGQVITIIDGVTVINAAGAGGAGGAGAGGAGGAGDGTNIGDGATPLAGPADTVDLNNDNTPLTDPSLIEDEKTPGVNWPLIGGGAAAVAAIAAAVLALARRRRDEEEEFEDE